MSLYKFFSCNVEVQYKGYLLSKAMFFTAVTTLLTILLPFLLAHRGRGFWLKSHSFYEHPLVHANYEYLLYLETGDPSQPIICSDELPSNSIHSEENCAEIQIEENKCKDSETHCQLNVFARLNVPSDQVVTSVMILFGLDFQLNGVCPMHMQSYIVIDKDIPVPSSGLNYQGDLLLYQTKHLPCHKNSIDARFNITLLNFTRNINANRNFIDIFFDNYYQREVTTRLNTAYSRKQIGHTGTFDLNIKINVHQVKVDYTPSLLQELKHAWPQYLSLVIVFNWIFNKVKRFVFNNRLLMAWEVVPWKRKVK